MRTIHELETTHLKLETSTQYALAHADQFRTHKTYTIIMKILRNRYLYVLYTYTPAISVMELLLLIDCAESTIGRMLSA